MARPNGTPGDPGNSERVRAFYSLADHDEVPKRGFMRWLARRDEATIFALLDPHPGLAALDAGCGTGLHARRLTALGLRVTAVDFSSRMVEKTRPQVAEAIEADLETMSLGRRFDRILCSGALEFVGDPERAITNLADHLRDGGRLVVMGPRRSLGGRLYHAWHRSSNHIRTHLLDEDALDRAARAAGLEPLGRRRPFLHSTVMAWARPTAPP